MGSLLIMFLRRQINVKEAFVFDYKKILVHIALIIGGITMLIPFIWMILNSFKTYTETMQVPIKWIPSSFRFTNYSEVLNFFNFGRYYANTIFVTIVTTVLTMLISTTAAYAFARLKFPGRDLIFFIMLGVMMVPTQMTLIPRYLIMYKLDWINTFTALIVPNLFSIFNTFFLRQYFMSLPKELEDAAKIDGCSYFRTFWKIFLPLCTTSMIAIGYYTIMSAWNDFLWPLIITNSDSMRVISVGMSSLQGEHMNETQYLTAASVMATLPILALFIFAQKQFIEGISISGIKA
jgi:multiple sugar transport system permease protein